MYVQMRDDIGNALMKPKKEDEEMMEKCGKMTVEGRILFASTTKENAGNEEYHTFELKVMDGKSLLYCGEYRPLERGTYNVYVDVVFSEQRNQRITDGLRLKDRRFRCILKMQEGWLMELVKVKKSVQQCRRLDDHDREYGNREKANRYTRSFDWRRWPNVVRHRRRYFRRK